ncbi:MAG TPA: PEGA domain-containing protein [Verrucomicrobiae bacterium]|nr:PEGA domain-containing protein [Verrucomicrobiae bacterium]
MRTKLILAASLCAAIAILAGCGTPIPPGAERGPHNTMAYDVLVEASPPGAQIVANGQNVGQTPLHIKIFGDPDGTFHDFGSYFYEVRALPVATNQFPQTHLFRTGHLLTPEDRIPSKIVFDMTQPSPAYPPNAGPGYAPPPYYYSYPYPYPYPYYGPYWGPGVRFYFGPGYRRW